MIFLMLVSSFAAFSQVDTLFLNNKKLACNVKEITGDAVKYSYPGEDLVNTVYKNTVQKIVFNNGRVQTFTESTSYKKVESVDDYENVTITAVESEVKGLYKLGDVSSKAKGTTTLSNQERVKERAYRKMKIEAAMLGANIIYLVDQRSEGNKYGGYFQSGSSTETSLTGVAYTNLVPDINEFNKLINGKSEFRAVVRHKMWSNDSDIKTSPAFETLRIQEVINDNGIATIKGKLAGENKYNSFRLTNFNDSFFWIYYKDKKSSYNYKLKL